MPRNVDWEIPGEIQPKPGDCSFDLDRALGAVLGLRATVPEDAFTAGSLGTERAGSAVLIRGDGLVLTIGYLVTEAETIWLTSANGGAVVCWFIPTDKHNGQPPAPLTTSQLACNRTPVGPQPLTSSRVVG
jgi:hypothetical protein